MGAITVLASIEDRVKQAGILYSSGLSTREVAAALGISKSTGSLYVKQSGVAMDGPARISKKMTGRIGARKGATHTEEAKQKMSIARKGQKPTLGTKRTPEQREKMRVAAIARAARPGESERRSLAMLAAADAWRLDPAERDARAKTRAACKRMLRRVLVMARTRKDLPTEQMLGYSQAQLRAHLEAQFRPGMSWSTRDSFHIDHKIPMADFFRRGIFDPATINALENLQVLTPDENRKKSDRVITINQSGTHVGIVG